MESNLQVSVVIPTYNRKDKLVRLIRSLLDSDISPLELIVVDDCSTDGTHEIIKKQFPHIRYIRHDAPTLVAKSINDGILASSADIVFVVDDDNVVEPNTITKLLSVFQNEPNVAVTCPVTCYLSEPDTIMYAGITFSMYSRRSLLLHSKKSCSKVDLSVVDVDSVANSFMVRRNAALQVGLIPSHRIPWNGEDGYLAYKIKRRLSKRVVSVPSAKVLHDVPKTHIIRYSTDMRLYYSVRSRIIISKDLDTSAQLFTFSLSIPFYLFFYLYVAVRSSRGIRGIFAVIKGCLSGLLM